MRNKLTPFLMNEYLFDYLENRLEEGRRKEIEKAIDESPELKLELQKIKKGTQYVEILSQSKVVMDPLNMPTEQSAIAAKTLEAIRFQTWPRGIKIGAEIFTVVFFVTLAVFVIPWNKMKTLSLSGNTGWIVSEVDRKSSPIDGSQSATEISADQGTEKYPDDEKVAEAVAKTATTFAASGSTAADSSAKGQVAVNLENGKKPDLVPSSNPPVVPPTTIPKDNKSATKVESVAAKETDDSKKFGYVFRGRIKVANVSSANPKLIEKVEGLGARKAGEVELGWKKGTGSYFHFTVPEAKYQELVDFFNGYGKLIISKDKHERKMPDGIIRVIIEVEELNTKENNAKAQPEETR